MIAVPLNILFQLHVNILNNLQAIIANHQQIEKFCNENQVNQQGYLGPFPILLYTPSPAPTHLKQSVKG